MGKGRYWKKFYVVILILATGVGLAFTGCGGGDDDNVVTEVISGTAAAGAPIIGTVTIKDSKGTEKVVPIEADGSYQMNVAGLIPAFKLRADGRVGLNEYHLFSAAVESDINGTVNITPFTDLIIADLSRQIAENYYDSNDFSGLTEEALAAAEQELQDILQPILTALGLGETIDLLRTSFNTDHTGLDQVIDVVKVTVDPNAVEATLTNVLNNEKVVIDIDGTSDSGTFTDTGVSDGISDFEKIMAGWKIFEGLFAESLPNPDNATLLSLFDPNFLEDGVSLDAWLTEITTDEMLIGIKITDIGLISMDANAVDGTAVISFTPVLPDDTTDVKQMVGLMTKNAGVWRWAGNGRIAHVSIRAEAWYMPQNELQPIRTGLRFTIESSYDQNVVQSVIVTGPGLPVDGVIFNRQIDHEWFAIAHDDDMYEMTDNMIDTISSNAEYSFVLMDDPNGEGNVLNSTPYKDTVMTRPLKLTELSVASFPAITHPTEQELAAFTGGNLTVSWTLPAGQSSHWLKLEIANSDRSETWEEEGEIPGSTTSKTFTVNFGELPFTPSQGGVCMDTTDMYRRTYLVGFWVDLN